MSNRLSLVEWFTAPLSGGLAIALTLVALVVACLIVLAMHWGEALRMGTLFDWKRRRAPAAPPAPAKVLRRAQRRAHALKKS